MLQPIDDGVRVLARANVYSGFVGAVTIVVLNEMTSEPPLVVLTQLVLRVGDHGAEHAVDVEHANVVATVASNHGLAGLAPELAQHELQRSAFARSTWNHSDPEHVVDNTRPSAEVHLSRVRYVYKGQGRSFAKRRSPRLGVV
eukprot:6810305-Pyramimonas_sp.AAC.1